MYITQVFQQENNASNDVFFGNSRSQCIVPMPIFSEISKAKIKAIETNTIYLLPISLYDKRSTEKIMTYEDFIVYSVIALVIVAIIWIFWTQAKEIKREQEIKKHIKDFDKRMEEIRRGWEVHDEDDNSKL